jgi:enoyl-CoA hydratase
VGLVNRVVPAESLLAEALSMAHLIAANAPLSVEAAKQLVQIATEVGAAQAVREADALYERVYQSEDALEGPRAFAEGRAPAWQGR